MNDDFMHNRLNRSRIADLYNNEIRKHKGNEQQRYEKQSFWFFIPFGSFFVQLQMLTYERTPLQFRTQGTHIEIQNALCVCVLVIL